MQFISLKKKYVKLVVLLNILFAFSISTGCNNNESSVLIVQKDERYDDVQEINDDILEYETLRFESEKGDIEIFYPRVKNVSEIGNVINDVIYNKVENIGKDNENKKMSRINFEITYYDRETLSILFYGTEKLADNTEIEYITDFNYDLPRNINIKFKNYFCNYNNDLIDKFKSNFGIDIKGDEKIYFDEIDGEKYLVLYYKDKTNDVSYERKYILDELVHKTIIGDFN